MGHTQLGKIPTTKAWRDVVGVIAEAGQASDAPDYSLAITRIASATMQAAAGAMRAARRDQGIGYIFFLLTQLALAARRDDFDDAMRRLGIELPGTASSIDLTVEVHRIIDERFLREGTKSDVAEMAQQALGEALASYLRARPRDLFAAAPAQLQADLHQLGTQRTFGEVSRQFFANLMSRLLGFYLSKIVRPGPEQNLIQTVGDLTRFNDELKRHAFQRSLVVHDFASRWFSKTEFEKGIDSDNARRFVNYACKKIESELMRGADGE